MKEKRSRTGKLSPTVKRLIAHRSITQRGIPRDYLAQELIKEIEGIGDVAPSFETTKRYISKARRADNPLDKPWTLGSCSEYPSHFSAESVSFIGECLLYQQKTQEEHPEIALSIITIRDAIWISRMHLLVDSFFSDLYKNAGDKYLYAINVGRTYSREEMFSESLKEEYFDSADIDQCLLTTDYQLFMHATHF